MVALSNSQSGWILIGVEDNGTTIGLTPEGVSRHYQLISNAASQHIRNPINPQTENVTLNGVIVMVVTVEPGIDKPYFDSEGVIWQKVGADNAVSRRRRSCGGCSKKAIAAIGRDTSATLRAGALRRVLLRPTITLSDTMRN